MGRFYPVIKAFPLEGPARPEWADYPAQALLLDGKRPGSGEAYPRAWAKPLLATGRRVILAGGLPRRTWRRSSPSGPTPWTWRAGWRRPPG